MRTLATLAAIALTLAQPVLAIAVDEPLQGHETASGLSLNEGRKWVADQRTVDSVAAMRSFIHKCPSKIPTASVVELHTVGQQLQDQLQLLIRGCTMTGPAHDQLHTWITALAPEIQLVIKSEDAVASRGSVERISQLLDAFDAHFEAGPKTE